MTLLRGLADDLPLMEWLQNHIWPAEAKHVSAQFVPDGPMFSPLRRNAARRNDLFQRHVLLSESHCKSRHFQRNACRHWVNYRRFFNILRSRYRRLPGKKAWLHAMNSAMNLCSVFALRRMLPTVNDRNFTKTLTLAEQCGLPIHLHLHETKQEIDDSLQRFGIRPIERLHRLELLSPGLIATGSSHREEIALLAQLDAPSPTARAPT